MPSPRRYGCPCRTTTPTASVAADTARCNARGPREDALAQPRTIAATALCAAALGGHRGSPHAPRDALTRGSTDAAASCSSAISISALRRQLVELPRHPTTGAPLSKPWRAR